MGLPSAQLSSESGLENWVESGIEIGLEGVTESGGWRMESDGEWYKSAVGSCCELEV